MSPTLPFSPELKVNAAVVPDLARYPIRVASRNCGDSFSPGPRRVLDAGAGSRPSTETIRDSTVACAAEPARPEGVGHGELVEDHAGAIRRPLRRSGKLAIRRQFAKVSAIRADDVDACGVHLFPVALRSLKCWFRDRMRTQSFVHPATSSVG